MTIKKTIAADQPLTKAQALSLRRSGKMLTPAQRAVLEVEELTSAEWTQMEAKMMDLEPTFVRKLEGLTPAEIHRLLSGKLDADEVRKLLGD